ncbi:MAG: trypsin-like peptidase domain-containing protein [Chloroflexota bacterium]
MRHGTRVAGKWFLVFILPLVLAGTACLSPVTTPAPTATVVVADTPAADDLSTKEVVETEPIIISSFSPDEASLVSLYHKVNPSVVHIKIYGDGGLPLGSGSGFVADEDGRVVTNAHVVRDAVHIEIVYYNSARRFASVIGLDADADLAVLEVDEPPLDAPALTLGNSDQVQVGQNVIAIGNPFGYQGSMTVGIISGLGRRLDSQRDLQTLNQGKFSNPGIIQTDAAINPGNSGGPLLDSEGKVIGINTAISSLSGSSSGVGFASPIDTLKKLLPHLIAEGSYDYPWLGVSSLPELDLFTMQELGITESRGVLITNVNIGGPAYAAGIRAGDFIVEIDGRQLNDFGDLIGYLVAETEPGTDVEFHVLRDGEVELITVTLGKRP